MWRTFLRRAIRRGCSLLLSWLEDKRAIISWTKWSFVRAVMQWSFFLWVASAPVISVLYLPSSGLQEVIRKLLVALPVCVLVGFCFVSLGFAGVLIGFEMNSTRGGTTVTTLKCTASVQELRLVIPQRLARLGTKSRGVALPGGKVVIRAHNDVYLLLGYVVLQRQGEESMCSVIEYQLLKAYGRPARQLKRRVGWRLIENVSEVVRGMDPEVVIWYDSRRRSARRKAKSGEGRG